MEKQPIHNVQVINRGGMSRRTMLGGLAGSAATVGAMGYVGANYESPDDDEVVRVPSPVTEEETIETYNELSDSGYFKEEVRRNAEEFSAEVPAVLENYDVYTTIQEHFQLPNIPRATVRNNLEALAPAIGFAESRYKNAMSEVGAFGVMQLMPGTWEELANSGEDRENLAVQVQVAARLLEQSYQHVTQTCKNELEYIEAVFFAGDSEAFETQFLTPLFINSYNAGMGSMVNLIQEFLKLCPTPADTVELFEQSETLTGYDVFIGMTHTGSLRGWAKWYKEVAADYTCKVYGAHTAVAEYFAQQTEENS